MKFTSLRMSGPLCHNAPGNEAVPVTQFTPDQRTETSGTGPTPFGTLLKQLRTAAGLTQTELAERAAMSWRGIADLERGVRRAPYATTVRRLAEALLLSQADRARLFAASGRSLGDVDLPALQPSGIPSVASSLVGREDELSQIKRLLEVCRLLTLTGPPGVGKTRLAYEAARVEIPACSDGATAVELASLADSSLVPQAVATSLGSANRPGQPMLDTLVDVLRNRRVLLVLDNCEHVLEACRALVKRLLEACPDIRIIATSRAQLQIAGETLVNVP